jgi:hypothetical protein
VGTTPYLQLETRQKTIENNKGRSKTKHAEIIVMICHVFLKSLQHAISGRCAVAQWGQEPQRRQCVTCDATHSPLATPFADDGNYPPQLHYWSLQEELHCKRFRWCCKSTQNYWNIGLFPSSGILISRKHTKKAHSVALSSPANYTDWANATCRRNLMPTYVDSGVSRGQRGGSLTVVNLSFLHRSRYFSFK